jgi:hypothetical protein
MSTNDPVADLERAYRDAKQPAVGTNATLLELDRIYNDVTRLADQMGEHEPRLRELSYIINDIFLDIMEARAWKDTFGG